MRNHQDGGSLIQLLSAQMYKDLNQGVIKPGCRLVQDVELLRDDQLGDNTKQLLLTAAEQIGRSILLPINPVTLSRSIAASA